MCCALHYNDNVIVLDHMHKHAHFTYLGFISKKYHKRSILYAVNIQNDPNFAYTIKNLSNDFFRIDSFGQTGVGRLFRRVVRPL